MNQWRCKEDCKAECCGFFPISQSIINENRAFFQVEPVKEIEIGLYRNAEPVITVLTEDGACIFLNRETYRCVIYEIRPKVCRLMGTTPKLLCPYIDMSGKARLPSETKRVKKYIEKENEQKLRQITEKFHGENDKGKTGTLPTDPKPSEK